MDHSSLDIMKKINQKGRASKKEIGLLERLILKQVDFSEEYIRERNSCFLVFFNNVPFAGILENDNYAEVQGFSNYKKLFSNDFWVSLTEKLVQGASVHQEKLVLNENPVFTRKDLAYIGEKMSRGMRSRDTNKAIEFQKAVEGKTAICKCPFHRNGGRGTQVPLSLFNRHGDSGNAQAMCGDGKKLIENINHKFKRLTLFALTYPLDFLKLQEKVSKQFQALITSAQNQALKSPNYKRFKDLYSFENPSTDGKTELMALNELEKLFIPKNIGLYDQGYTFEDGAKLVEELNSIMNTSILLEMEEHQKKFLDGKYKIKDSKTGNLYPVELVGANLSKKNWLYDLNNKKTTFRANVHNTIESGQRGANNRAKKWLAGGDHLEANKMMSKLGKEIENVHIDHIVALSLGGIHDPKNLRPLPPYQNIADKDKLTEERYIFLKENPHCLSPQHRAIFEQYKENRIMLELQLKKSVREYREKIRNMEPTEQLKALKSHFPGLNETKLKDLQSRYFCLDEESEE